MKTRLRSRTILTAVLAACAAPAFGAEFMLINADGPDEGFNDPTAVAPVGNNTGTTLGEQRIQAFEFTMGLWGALLESEVPIVVEAMFDPLFCTPDTGILGQATYNDLFADFAGAPVPDTWYVSALADKLAGVDQAPGDPDIVVMMNSALDNSPSCLGTTTWYYGLDGNGPDDSLDIVETILHELAHGLGFLETTINFAFQGGTPDIFSRFLFDIELGATWGDITSNIQRSRSATNRPDLVWNGPAVTAMLGSVLDNAALLTVAPPSTIAGEYAAQAAHFGPPLSPLGLTRQVANAMDTTGNAQDGCEPFVGFPAGRIALINDGGPCVEADKVFNAQVAGASGAIIVNAGLDTGMPSMTGSDASITIPSVGVTQATGDLLRAAPGTQVTLGIDPVRLAATTNGLLRMYSPPEFEAGSSVSHWTDAAIPDLLMEPFAGTLAPFEVDLTIAAFQDIGWTRSPVFTTQPPATHPEEVTLNYTARVTDPDVNDTVQLVDVTLPPWLRVTGRGDRFLTFNGTPAENTAGDYRLLLRATDSYGNVTDQDTIITVTGTNDIPVFESVPPTQAEIEALYVYNVVVSDADPNDSVSLSIAPPRPSWLMFVQTGDGLGTLSGTPTEDDLGQHPVTIRALDSGGSTFVTQSFTITVADGPPVITLNGQAMVTLQCGGTFIDPGARAVDAVDGEVDVTAVCAINEDAPGEYTCTYTAEDSLGNVAMATRTITIVDTTDPVVTLSGAAQVTLRLGDPFVDPGATATDACAGALDVVVGGDTVDVDSAGTYTVTYTATDPSGNSTQATRTVTVQNDLAPTIALVGSASITTECHETFNDPGATATDREDAMLEIITTCTLDVDTPGVYTCTYTVQDSGGNTAMVERTVTVVDTTGPVITLNGDAEIALEVGDTYTDPGATVMDACDDTVTVEIGGQSVNTGIAGTYVVLYNAEDASGNTADTISRRVVVGRMQNPGCSAGSGGGSGVGDRGMILAMALFLLMRGGSVRGRVRRRNRIV